MGRGVAAGGRELAVGVLVVGPGSDTASRDAAPHPPAASSQPTLICGTPLALATPMRHTPKTERRCTYIVAIAKNDPAPDELRSLSEYFSSLGIAGCDVVVLDASPADIIDENRRVLRWVARHVAVTAPFDIVRLACDIAACEKVIVAAEEVRYNIADLTEVCALLDAHEVVEPEEYLDPLPWWGGIDAGRMLVHRAVDPVPDHGATFAFRRTVVRSLRGFDATDAADPVRTLARFGAEVHPAEDLFVRRCPVQLGDWLRERPRVADREFDVPAKTAFFFGLIPMAILLTLLGGPRVAVGYTSAVAFLSIVLAVRGRSGAGAFFPLRAVFYAPLWVLERSVSVYWALLQRVRGGVTEVQAEPATQHATKVASGE